MRKSKRTPQEIEKDAKIIELTRDLNRKHKAELIWGLVDEEEKK